MYYHYYLYLADLLKYGPILTDLLKSSCLQVTFLKRGFEAIQNVAAVAVHHSCVYAQGQAGEVYL